jgi:hypothetical protein
MWVSKWQIKDMISRGEFFPYDYLEILPD